MDQDFDLLLKYQREVLAPTFAEYERRLNALESEVALLRAVDRGRRNRELQRDEDD